MLSVWLVGNIKTIEWMLSSWKLCGVICSFYNFWSECFIYSISIWYWIFVDVVSMTLLLSSLNEIQFNIRIYGGISFVDSFLHTHNVLSTWGNFESSFHFSRYTHFHSYTSFTHSEMYHYRNTDIYWKINVASKNYRDVGKSPKNMFVFCVGSLSGIFG